MGRALLDLRHELEYPTLHEDLTHVLSHGVPVEREVVSRNELWFLSRVVPYRTLDNQTGGVVLALVDISDRKRAESVMTEEFRYTKILQDLGARLVTEENIQTIYEEMLTAAIEITGAAAGTVQMLDEVTQELVLLATRGFSQETVDYFHRVDASSSTSCGLALRTSARSFFDFNPASRDKSIRLHIEDGLLSAQSSPLVSRAGKSIGMVSTHWREAGHRPSERELRFLDLLARQAADIIERRHTERMIRHNQAWLAGQKQALQTALSGAPLEESLAVLVGSSIEHFGPTTRAAFYLADRNGKTLYHVVGMGPEYTKKCEGFPIGPDSFACGLAIHNGQPILTTDVRQEPLWEQWLWITESFDFRACGSFPLQTSEGRVLGTFAVYWREPHKATPADVDFATGVADTASIIVARHNETEERKRAEELLRASKETYLDE